MASFLSLFFIWQIENFGFLSRKIIFFLSKKIDKTKDTVKDKGNIKIDFSPFLINIFLGLLAFGMIFFFIGSLRILSKEIVLLMTLISSVCIFVFFKRWQEFSYSNLKSFFDENKFILLGVFLFFILTLPFTFRPITNFDALWYHLTIPKFFLQEGNIDYLGVHTRYSVHPYLNFFWNLWPLSLPLSIPLQGMIINFFQTFVVGSGLLLASQIGKNLFSWSRLLQVLAPVLIGITPVSLIWFGAGYNDLYGMIFGLIAVLYTYHLSQKNEVYFHEFIVLICLLISTFLIKIFFAIFIVFVFLYFLFTNLDKLTFLENKKVLAKEFWSWKNLKILILSLFLLFSIFILPWIVRSLIFTGRPLDPIGAPGITEDAYAFAGSGDSVNHWTKFIWLRFLNSFPNIILYNYGLFFALGVFAFLQKSFWEKYKNLWLVGFSSFWVIYFLSIVTQWRYFLASASLLVFLGLTSIGLIKHINQKILAFVVIFLFLVNISFTYYSSYYADNRNRDIYILKGQTYDDFLSDRNGKWMYDYYQSDNSVLPEGLNSSEKIFVFGVHNLAYIKNPIITIDSHNYLFKNTKTVQEFVEVLKDEGVKFLLLKRSNIEILCEKLNLENSETFCVKNIETKLWFKVGEDGEQQVVWVKLK